MHPDTNTPVSATEGAQASTVATTASVFAQKGTPPYAGSGATATVARPPTEEET